MAGVHQLHPELQARLQQLDQELEEGEITQKGYEKRRAILFEQFGVGVAVGPEAEGNVSPLSYSSGGGEGGHSRNTSMGGLSVDNGPGYNGGYGGYNGRTSPLPAAIVPGAGRGLPAPSQHMYRPETPQGIGHVGRFQEQQLGMRNPNRRGSGTGVSSEMFYDSRSSGYSGDTSRSGTLQHSDYAFNPAQQQGYFQEGGAEYQQYSPGGQSRLSTMGLESQQYFQDFTGQQMEELQHRQSYGGPQRYSTTEAFSPSALMPPPSAGGLGVDVIQHQLPLEPRDIPFAVYDSHNPNTSMSKFENIGAVLRHRGKTNGKQAAYWVLDQRGKEIASISWEKLTSRAEKVAQVIRDKSNLYRGDRVALVYRDTEIIEFAVALMGCFIAGVVAVPINSADDYQKLSLLLTTTQAHLALTTDNNLKAFHRDIQQNKLKWPQGVEWWKTNEFGGYHPKKKDETPALQVPDLAYIEFSRAPTGDLRGVVLSHRTIMHQMACLSAIIQNIPFKEKLDTMSSELRGANGSFLNRAPTKHEIILSYLDPREGPGLILGVLLGVYGGHTTVWLESKTVETPGLYAHLISKYTTTIMVADYPGLKRAVYNYQQDPMATRNYKKGQEPNFGSVKLVLIDTLTVDCEFHEVLADRWLRPMRNHRARELVAPMLCLPEHGGMIISVRDWLGGEERMGCDLSMTVEEEVDEDSDGDDKQGVSAYNSLIGGTTVQKTANKRARHELSEVLLDKEPLKQNEIVVLAVGEEARKRANEPGTVRAGAFGYPIPDATLALVDPETHLLCSPFMVGEIWVDSPSLSGGFWALPKHTETIFHARPYRFIEGSPTPVIVEPEFLRTGLLGCVIEGKVFVLGLYEDRIRQKIEWQEQQQRELTAPLRQGDDHRYFFVQHLTAGILRTVPKVYDCSAFDAHVNGEYLPFILVESQAASTAPTNPGGPPRQLDIPFLDSLAERCMDVLYREHHLRIYCVMITAPNTLPRVVKNGRREIGNMLCRREFDNGSLPCVHVKFGIERAVQNLPLGDDPSGGIWSPLASMARAELLQMHDKQYSGVDHREVVIDDRTSTPLNQFSNIEDLLQWRVSRQAEELAYCTVDARGREGKGINWKKFDTKVAAVAMYLKNKVKVRPGDHLLLMYTHSEEFVYAVHACFCLGAVAIPMAPLDENRLHEDTPALLHMVTDFKIKAVLVNNDTEHLMKQKPVSQHIKQSANILKVNMPNTYNTTKPPKQSQGCRNNGLTIRPAWVQAGYPVLIWTYWTPDQRRIAVQLGHDTLMALCKVQKETCQMTSTRPVFGCVRSTVGLGFIHTCLMGIFLASPTYLVSPVDFGNNPNVLFQTLSRYKIKDTYATLQMMNHAMATGAGKMAGLHELKNLMITVESRPKVDVYNSVRVHFAQSGLDRTAINTIYSHVLNPMVASRSYMCIEPIELFLDMNALRRGLIMPVDPDTEPFAMLIQDSGMVPVSTQISIVNPETNRLCQVGEYGEIWVQSEANGYSFYGSKDAFDAERFNGRTIDGDPNVKYMRTGDLGFLHNVSRPIGPGGALVDMQVLFVLGSIGETFEVNGLSHFPMDIETSIEKCHRNIVPGGSAVFQAGGLIVVIVEVFRKNFLASLVPVIVNAVLNEHHLIVDIVGFVGRGDFPRSRLGEKQRGKILASWVTRKLRSIAQFSIRDFEDGEGGTVEIPVPERRGTGLSNTSGNGASKHPSIVSIDAPIPEGQQYVEDEAEYELMQDPQQLDTGESHDFDFAPEQPPENVFADHDGDREATPTSEYPSHSAAAGTAISTNDGLQHTHNGRPVPRINKPTPPAPVGHTFDFALDEDDRDPAPGASDSDVPAPPPPRKSSRNTVDGLNRGAPHRPLSFEQDSHSGAHASNAFHNGGAPSPETRQLYEEAFGGSGSGGGLRVANRASVDSAEYPVEALGYMHMQGGEHQ